MRLLVSAIAVTVAVLLLAPVRSQRSGGLGGIAEAQAGARVPAAPRGGRGERPLPAYEGIGIDGQPLSVSKLIGKRLLLFFFDPSLVEARMVGRAVAGVAQERTRHNFEIVGVAVNGSLDTVKSFVTKLDVEIPVLHDTSAGFASRLNLRAPLALIVADASGYIIDGSVDFSNQGENPSAVVEQRIREWLRLPPLKPTTLSALRERPKAPLFRATRLDGGEPFELASLRGRPVVLIFFLHTCPHCHRALRFFKNALARIPEEKRPVLVGVSGLSRTIAIRQRLEEEGLDFFPVLLDDDGSIRGAYGAQGAVPTIFLIDADGSIVSRTEGWREEREPPLMRMRLAKLAGEEVPMLLHKTGYSGNEFCDVCHERENETWLITNHARAFDTLVRHGAERDAECVSCHVVGFEEPGGFSLSAPALYLEDVGCETCHGRGGSHLAANPSDHSGEEPDYERACKSCHSPKHSLGFDYPTFLSRISHEENSHLAELPIEEQRRILEKRRKPRETLLPTSANYTGSQACRSCHEAEFATWSRQPHATAVAKLAGPSEAENAECLRCHTTAFGKPGGFPADGQAAAHPDLAGVGCESCHGPGSEHVKPETPKIGNIVALGDKCDSCVILQICGSCHDEANDPGFEFEVVRKIELQRHGTIEAGTGKPLDQQAAVEGRESL